MCGRWRIFLVVPLAAVVAIGQAVASGDEIKIGKLTYRDVKIVSSSNGQVMFKGLGDNNVSKPVRDIAFLMVDGEQAMNRAENLLLAGKSVEAARAYKQAESMVSDLLCELVKYRRLTALDRAGMIDEATDQWLMLMNKSPDTGTASLRPVRLLPAGAEQNVRAINLLVAAREDAKAGTVKRCAIDDMLFELYRREGKSAHLAELANAMLAVKSSAESSRKLSLSSPSALQTRFRAMGVMIDQRPRQVLKELQTGLISGPYADWQIPWALFLSGQARQHLAGDMDGDDKRAMLVVAGLDFMRVFTFYSASPQAPEALLAAGEINVSLGNRWAARNAWQAVVKKYPDSQAARAAEEMIAAGTKLRNDYPTSQPTGTASSMVGGGK